MNDVLRLREVVQWDINSDNLLARYDFAYRDPASKAINQIGISVLVFAQPVLDRLVVPAVKAQLVKLLNLKCGVKRAIGGQYILDLSVGAQGRYV